MGLCISSDIFQAHLGQLFQNMENVLIYIDKIQVISHGSFKDHLKLLEMAFAQLINKGMQVHAGKCEWFRDTVDYLGYTITRNGVRPQKKKIDKILAIKEPKNASEVRSSLEFINYYRYMWKQRSTLILPLTKVLKKDRRTFKWISTTVQHTVYNQNKNNISISKNL